MASALARINWFAANNNTLVGGHKNGLLEEQLELFRFFYMLDQLKRAEYKHAHRPQLNLIEFMH